VHHRFEPLPTDWIHESSSWSFSVLPGKRLHNSIKLAVTTFTFFSHPFTLIGRCITVAFDRALSYTGCPRRNVPDLGRVFLMLKYTDITQNTYVQSWTVTEIMAREKCGLLAGPRTVPVSWRSYPYPSLSVVSYHGNSAHARSKLLMYFLHGDKVLHVSAWHSCHV